MTAGLIAIGSYTETYGDFRAKGDGIALLSLSDDGRLALVDRLGDLPNPSYLEPIADGRFLAALEVDDERSGIATIAVDHAAHQLRLVHRQATPGQVLCHLDRHPAGWVAGACYGSGHVFTRRLTDAAIVGGDDGGGSVIARQGRSIHPERQTRPHPHAVRFSPDGRWLVVPDLGTDEVACYRFSAADGQLDPTPRIWRAPSGSGPRLLHFSPDGRFVMLVHELTSEVSCLGFEDGMLRPVARVSSLIAPFAGENTAAGLYWHPTRRILAVSNRGADRIALLHVDEVSGVLSPWFEIPSGGDKPRDFAFSACGRWIIVANQNSDSVVLWELDWDRGVGRDTGSRLTIGTPSCVRVMSNS